MMQFCPKNREDIVRYFRNTFIKLREFGDMLFFIEQVEQYRITGTAENGEKFCIYMHDDTPYEMEYILPHKSFFQYGANAAQLVRVPAKQYLRGLSESNTSILVMGSDGKPKAATIDFAVLRAFVNKGPWPTLSAAYNSEHASVALSSRIALCRVQRSLYVDFMHVASINAGQQRIDVKKHLFYDEIVDLLKSTGEDKNWNVVKYVPQPKKENTTSAIREQARQDQLKAKLAAKHYGPVFQQGGF